MLRTIACVCAAALCGITFAAQARTARYANVHAFCDPDCNTDGQWPEAGLILDGAGNFYGTTSHGGHTQTSFHSPGTIFELTGGAETILYTFCRLQLCKDGQFPTSTLYRDSSGNLYGTTISGGTDIGGAEYAGVVFELTAGLKERVLYNFCSTGGTACTDGNVPVAGVVADSSGDFYGTTTQGGPNAEGEIWEIDANGTFSVFHSFCSQTGCADGEAPGGGNLLIDRSGNLYGTTTAGGTAGGGIVFEFSPSGTESVLYNFCSVANCTDGQGPYGAVVKDKDGNLYGTTEYGGLNTNCSGGCGTVFKLSPSGAETVLYNFCSKPNCADGQWPVAGVSVRDTTKKVLYGTTASGGTGFGVVFSVSAKKEAVLHTFYRVNDAYAEWPYGGVIFSQGYLYGTAAHGGGGSGESGVVFQLRL